MKMDLSKREWRYLRVELCVYTILWVYFRKTPFSAGQKIKRIIKKIATILYTQGLYPTQDIININHLDWASNFNLQIEYDQHDYTHINQSNQLWFITIIVSLKVIHGQCLTMQHRTTIGHVVQTVKFDRWWLTWQWQLALACIVSLSQAQVERVMCQFSWRAL